MENELLEFEDWLEEESGIERFSESDIEEAYREWLDEAYGSVSVAGMEFDTSRLLEEVDPIAFRVGCSDFDSEYYTELDSGDYVHKDEYVNAEHEYDSYVDEFEVTENE